MSKIINKGFNKSLATWADLQALPDAKKKNGAQITVLDAVGDTRTLGGTVVYQYISAFAGTVDEWMIVSQINEEGVTSVEETLTITDGKVELLDKPNNGVLLSCVALWDEAGVTVIDDLTYSVTDNIVTVGAEYNDKKLKVKYLKNTSGKMYQLGSGGTGGSSAFADITNKPNTLAGYGITDGVTFPEVISYVSGTVSNLVGAAPEALNTLEEISVKLNDEADAVAAMVVTLSTKATQATSLSGYGITDAYTKSEADAKYIVDANYVHTDNNYTTAEKAKLASLSNFDPTSINTSITSLQGSKADKATTLSGYGITDAYTKTETTSLVSSKASTTTAQTFSGAQRTSTSTITYASAVSIDLSINNHFTVTLAGNMTFTNPTNLVVGQEGVITVQQDATGGRSIAWGSYFKFIGGTLPTYVLTANSKSSFVYHVMSSTEIVVVPLIDWK